MISENKSLLLRELVPHIAKSLRLAGVPRILEDYLKQDDSDLELFKTYGQNLVQLHFGVTATIIANKLAEAGIFTKQDLSKFATEAKLTALGEKTGINPRWLSLLIDNVQSSRSTLPITVVIADDHSLFRDGVRKLLESESDFKILGEAINGAEALNKIKQLKPDVAIIDINMPKMNGLEVTARLKSERATTRVILLTAYDDATQLTQSFQDGASGFLSKEGQPNKLIDAVRVVAGGQYFCDAVHSTRVRLKHCLENWPKRITRLLSWKCFYWI
jgi:DNA-binding NarL/FixJ family response regulator